VIIKRNVRCSARLATIAPATAPRRRAPRALTALGQDFLPPLSVPLVRWVTIALEGLLLRHAQLVLTEPPLP
jgi:hypothetical protein